MFRRPLLNYFPLKVRDMHPATLDVKNMPVSSGSFLERLQNLFRPTPILTPSLSWQVRLLKRRPWMGLPGLNVFSFRR